MRAGTKRPQPKKLRRRWRLLSQRNIVSFGIDQNLRAGSEFAFGEVMPFTIRAMSMRKGGTCSVWTPALSKKPAEVAPVSGLYQYATPSCGMGTWIVTSLVGLV